MRGYFVWTLLDNFEWNQGTAARFGLLHVDFATQRRTAKGSASFFASLSESHSFVLQPDECNATLSVQPLFLREAAQLQQIVNRTAELTKQSGQVTSPPIRTAIVQRATRLAALADVQARHHAEQGAFKLMRAWSAKAVKMRSFVERQRRLLDRLISERDAAEQPVESAAAADSAASTDEAAEPHADGATATTAQRREQQQLQQRRRQQQQRQRQQQQQQPAAGGTGKGVDRPLDALPDITIAKLPEAAVFGEDLPSEALVDEESLDPDAILPMDGAELNRGGVPSSVSGEPTPDTEGLQTAVIEAAPVDSEDAS